MDSYLIEYRILGLAREQILEIMQELQSQHYLKSQVPHITLAGPIFTNDEQRLVNTIKTIVEDYSSFPFKLENFGKFEETNTLFIQVKPSFELKKIRLEIMKALNPFCTLTTYDRQEDFAFHVTLGNKLPNFKFNEIWSDLQFREPLQINEYVTRIAIIKNMKILYEYDLVQKKLLSREEALDYNIIAKTLSLLKNKINDTKPLITKSKYSKSKHKSSVFIERHKFVTTVLNKHLVSLMEIFSDIKENSYEWDNEIYKVKKHRHDPNLSIFKSWRKTLYDQVPQEICFKDIDKHLYELYDIVSTLIADYPDRMNDAIKTITALLNELEEVFDITLLRSLHHRQFFEMVGRKRELKYAKTWKGEVYNEKIVKDYKSETNYQKPIINNFTTNDWEIKDIFYSVINMFKAFVLPLALILFICYLLISLSNSQSLTGGTIVENSSIKYNNTEDNKTETNKKEIEPDIISFEELIANKDGQSITQKGFLQRIIKYSSGSNTNGVYIEVLVDSYGNFIELTNLDINQKKLFSKEKTNDLYIVTGKFKKDYNGIHIEIIDIKLNSKCQIEKTKDTNITPTLMPARLSEQSTTNSEKNNDLKRIINKQSSNRLNLVITAIKQKIKEVDAFIERQKTSNLLNGAIITEKINNVKIIVEKQKEKENSDYRTNPRERIFEYNLNGRNGQINLVVYKGLKDYLASLPREISYYAIPPTDKDFILKNIDNEEQLQFMLPLVDAIKKITPNKDEQAKIAISLVQNIPYDWNGFTSGNIIGRNAYEVLYDYKGVCGEKTELLALLLRELGFGVVLFKFDLEQHQALGIKCPEEYSYMSSGYCFVEATQPTIITDVPKNYVGVGELKSKPKIIIISEGNVIRDVKQDYMDARFLEQLENLGPVLDYNNYNQWQYLVNHYGLKVA